jgi:serine/threonine-protein kinase
MASLPADIWALGAILYQLISGKVPFGKGLNAAITIVNAKTPDQPALFSAKPQFRPLTDDLWSIVLACLQKDPGSRPTADQLVGMCEKLCYSCTERSTGSIRTFGGAGRGSWGFIQVDGGGEVFFHRDSVYGNAIARGSRVCFASYQGAPQPRVFPVLPLKV